MPNLQSLIIEVDKSFFLDLTADHQVAGSLYHGKIEHMPNLCIKYPENLRSLEIIGLNSAKDMFLIYDLPKNLRILTFRSPIWLDVEFLEGALKYLSKLTALYLCNIERMFDP
jgi:hypothetical protein